MNLLELITKNDPNVQVQIRDTQSNRWCNSDDAKSLFKKITVPRYGLRGLKPVLFKDVYRGLMLRSDMRIVVKHAANYWPDFAQGGGVFKLKSLDDKKYDVEIGWGSSEQKSLECKKMYVAVGKLRNISVLPASARDQDLIIQIPPQKGAKIFFGVHRLLDRNELYARCIGDGVEVGPGPKPQIHPDDTIKIKYIEQATPDQWHLLYGKDTKVPVDPDLWKHYVVGNADSIPVEDGSLDFIFSSHVIEHLANPLGHLAYWGKLLKKGGVIVAIIPDRSGCKDYVFDSSTSTELEDEYRRGAMDPVLAHYQRWAKHRAPGVDPGEILESGRSIHVHFYTPKSMREILGLMYKELGYRKYSVKSEHNHKDFFVILEK